MYITWWWISRDNLRENLDLLQVFAGDPPLLQHVSFLGKRLQPELDGVALVDLQHADDVGASLRVVSRGYRRGFLSVCRSRGVESQQ